ncbi:response regulator transcription factor [Neobacillus drentensis]|uniref:response regulator transcription factor n=1 Tax=Neobacillus drentensis TaxID=220684 RepID=UPI0028608EBB|nr:LuxR C-terminal-related transcriptional regulator [Neobacillus drentensis]MDR7236877.1 DNA-binding CsgD family transcriptional regulator [Neobacillus drentensis]
MTSQYTLQHRIQNLEEATCHEERLYKILDVFMDFYPVTNAYLFRYSPLGFLGEGIISLSSAGMVHIGDIRDDIRSLPIISSAINEKKAKYCSGIEYLKQTSSKYITSSGVNSLVVVPICYRSVIIGYICSNEFVREAAIDEKLLSSLTLYGKEVGKFFEKFDNVEDPQNLSKRELEVMRRIAWGESIKEMADSMQISELTVKQYVKTAIKKLGVQNRSHAIGELFRRGIIT